MPCTIKESIAVAGMPNCAGLVARRELRAERTAPTAQRLLDAGAIPLGVTNTSELTMWIESHNHVYGRTHNAYDPRRTAGGSSGGEGAAVGAGLAPIGLGCDIGGSIRLPAFFNGVFGHKPTPGLVPNSGQFPVTPRRGRRGCCAIGPLARRGEDLMPALRVLAGADPDDPFSRDVALGEPGDVSLAGLPVVVIDGRLIPPVSKELRAALDRAAGALEARGRACAARSRCGGCGPRSSPTWRRSPKAPARRRSSSSPARASHIRHAALLRRGAPHTIADQAADRSRVDVRPAAAGPHAARGQRRRARSRARSRTLDRRRRAPASAVRPRAPRGTA